MRQQDIEMAGTAVNAVADASGLTADWMLHRQLSEHAKGARSSAAANLFNAAVVCAAFSLTSPWFLLLGAFACLVALIAHRLWCNAKITEYVEGGTLCLHRLNQHVESNAFLLGCWWGLMIGVLFIFASSSEQMLLGIVGSGMMGAGTITYRTLERAARAFFVPIGLGALIGLLAVGTPPAYAACGLLACYAFVLHVSVRRSADSFVRMNQNEHALADSSETIRLLLNDYEEQGSDWLIEFDDLGLIKNPCARFAVAVGRPVETLVDFQFTELVEGAAQRFALSAMIAGSEAIRDHHISLKVGNVQHWWSISARPNRDGKGGYRGVVTDITAQRLAEEKVNYMAHYDGLTDLPNRFMFNDRLQRALNRDAQGTGLMYLDLDHFKSINDTLGHPVGDKLLKAVGLRLEACVRAGDLIARLGGDEFAILVGGENLSTIDNLAARIVEALALPFLIDGYEVVTGASIGIAYSPDHGDTPEALLKNADLALYAAKAEGRGRYVRFESGMDSAAEARRELETDLRTALARDEMRLHFQPLVDINTGEPNGYEALVRWEHHARGTVMPSDFIPIAEETGMVIKIGEWVIRRALEELSGWPEHLTVAVNLSPAQMRSPNLLPTVIHALAQNGVSAHRLEFEITETVLMHDSEANIATLHKLSALGVRIALDDFGTGYSSFNYLRSFPFDKIKIDRCFVEEIDSREDCRAIVRAVVSLATSLGIRTTAEGVERQSQLKVLKSEGCTEVQGFLFSKAVPPEELSDLRPLARRRYAA
jgi:diguanylate cyclase (GGDEF)-like protein